MALTRSRAVHNPIDVLSAPLLRAIFAFLPADQRARAVCVCRTWREVLADPALWLRLDLTADSGVSCRVDDAALRAACARAHGRLEALDITGCVHVRPTTLHQVAANLDALRELRTLLIVTQVRVPSEMNLEGAETLLRALPALRVVDADLDCDSKNVRRLLCHEPPFQPIQLQRLYLHWHGDDDVGQLFPAVMTELRAHASLKELCLDCTRTDDFDDRHLELTVDVACALRLRSLDLFACEPTPAAMPALVRLLSSTALKRLHINNELDSFAVMLDAAGAALLANALRANCTLHELSLGKTGFWVNMVAAALVLGALTGHASLRVLQIGFDMVDTEAERGIAGALLGALVAANAPPLVELDVSYCGLRDVGLEPIMASLPQNTHLRKLGIRRSNLSAGFIEQHLLPALLANTSLHQLLTGIDQVTAYDDEHAFEEMQHGLRRVAHMMAGTLGTDEAAAGGE